MLFYNKFYFRFGIRKAEHLLKPVINNLVDLRLPRFAAFHYLPLNSFETGMANNHWVMRDLDRYAMGEHVTEMSPNANFGKYRSTGKPAQTMILDYHKKHKNVKIIRNINTNLKHPKTLLIVNYALLNHLYRYAESIFTQLSINQNLVATLFANVNKYAKEVDRYHYVSIDLPTNIPTRTQFIRAEKDINRQLMEVFNTTDTLILLEIWKWLGVDRQSSLLNVVEKENYEKVNFIIRYESHWLTFNLSTLDNWRKELGEAVVEDDNGNINPDILQKRFLRILVSLFESSTPTVDESKEEIKDEDAKTSSSTKEIYEDEDNDIVPIEDNDKRVESREVKRIFAGITQSNKQLEDELSKIEEIQQQANQEVEVKVFEQPVEELESGYIETAKELAEDGIISAAEIRRFERIAKGYRELPNPYGKGKLVDFIKIDPETVKIDKPTELPVKSGLIDESMRNTTLHDFNSRYIKDVMKKDILNSVLNLTKAGVAIDKYEVETIEDVANKYESHTVRLVPVIGKPSTIHFRIPVVDEDGSYTANGVRYKMRNQRGDKPIRKVKSDRVALTSYYGKVFVTRSPKVVNDYGKWLVNSIKLASQHEGFNEESTRKSKPISNIKLTRNNLSGQKLPRVYSIIASRIGSFENDSYQFNFNYSDRESVYTKKAIESLDNSGYVPIGFEKDSNRYLVMDNNDVIHVSKDLKSFSEVGYIENLLGLDFVSSPVDFSQINVFNKNIPVALVIGYYVGLDNLVKALPGDVKRIITGERYSFEDGEYPIKFQDETLIVNRKDKLTSMVLGGLREYKNSLKRYSIHDFNKKDIYFNILEESGITGKYLNELDLLYDLFIDPITLELLVEMKEPTTWIDLLKRSSELLLTDWSPGEVDMEYMRIKGYERISGAVYKELVTSMRAYANKKGSSNASVDMKSFAIWQTINKDPAIALAEDSNPIKNLKEKESLTFLGDGGRGRQSMVGRTRTFTKSDIGVISEATVDSGDVAINTFLTPNCNITSLRGLTKPYKSEDGNSALVSTSALLSPGADSDD